MLHRVAADGAGTAVDKIRSNNSLAGKLVDDSRCVIEHFTNTDAAKLELANMEGWA